ncbi:MAG: NAD(P)-dependent oxidoreductase, partial [Thermoleophilia bacterium]|nr:NAD(P)-dependent oxidoreductase [Thermoleophilia bacterium]
GHVGQTYELGGDQAISLADLAAIVGTAAGTTVTYVDLPEAEYATLLEGYGLPAAFVSMLADSDTGIARGHLRTDSGDLARLIGRPTQTVAEVVQVHVDALKAAV